MVCNIGLIIILVDEAIRVFFFFVFFFYLLCSFIIECLLYICRFLHSTWNNFGLLQWGTGNF